MHLLVTGGSGGWECVGVGVGGVEVGSGISHPDRMLFLRRLILGYIFSFLVYI